MCFCLFAPKKFPTKSEQLLSFSLITLNILMSEWIGLKKRERKATGLMVTSLVIVDYTYSDVNANERSISKYLKT